MQISLLSSQRYFKYVQICMYISCFPPSFPKSSLLPLFCTLAKPELLALRALRAFPLASTPHPCPTGSSLVPAADGAARHPRTLVSLLAQCGRELGGEVCGKEFLPRSLVAQCHRSTPRSLGLENTLTIKRSPIS